MIAIVSGQIANARVGECRLEEGGKKAKMRGKSRVKRCRAGICGSLGNLIEKLGYAGSCVCQRIKGTARHKLD